MACKGVLIPKSDCGARHSGAELSPVLGQTENGGFEERLSYGIVLAVSFAIHRDLEPALLQEFLTLI